MGFRVWGLGFGGLGFGGLGFRGFRVFCFVFSGLGFRVWGVGLGFRPRESFEEFGGKF